MSHRAVVTYQLLLQLVQQLPGLEAHQLDQQRSCIVRLSREVSGLSSLPRDAWDELIKAKVWQCVFFKCGRYEFGIVSTAAEAAARLAKCHFAVLYIRTPVMHYCRLQTAN